MKSAVTGGSGVVGAAVVRHLVAAGHEVRGLARSSEARGKLEALGASAIDGDVLDPDSLHSLVEDADLVFHVAGINEMCSPDPDLMDRVNIEGTRSVIEAAKRAGVARLVHTSSAATLGEAAGQVGSEETAHRGWYRSRYERSKRFAEEVALEASGVEVVVVNPSSVQGPGRATGTGKLILDVLTGRLSFLVDAPIALVDIDDCAAGHVLAAQNGRPGRRYVLSGANLTVKSALAAFAEVTGSSPEPRFVPGWMASWGAAAIEGVGRASGRRPPVCREMVRVLRAGARYDGRRATDELGLDYTPIGDTIRRTVDWFRSEGLLV